MTLEERTVTVEPLEGALFGEDIASTVADSVYRMVVSRVLSVVETMLDEGDRLMAYRKVIKDVADGIGKDTRRMLDGLLDGVEIPVSTDAPLLSDEEAEAVAREWEEADRRTR